MGGAAQAAASWKEGAAVGCKLAPCTAQGSSSPGLRCFFLLHSGETVGLFTQKQKTQPQLAL